MKYLIVGAGAVCLLAGGLWAQGRGGAQPPAGPPPTPQAAAPVDLTGYWVSVITEDWRFRMVTPPKGDFPGVPLNPEGIRVANTWDRDKDIAAGEQCRAFGAAGIMRMPVRLHITWQDANTLKVDIDNGTQTRLFHFDQKTAAPAQADWQGLSVASWEMMAEGQGQAAGAGGGGGGGGRGRGGPPPLSGSLKVMTTHMKPGYLRRNGVPYSGNAVMTEYFDRTTSPNGDTWLVLTSSLDDPQYLMMPFMLTDHFKKEPDGSKFMPRPCEATPVVDGQHE
jgi:hypothetical protein